MIIIYVHWLENDFVGVITKIILINTPNELKPILELKWFILFCDTLYNFLKILKKKLI